MTLRRLVLAAVLLAAAGDAHAQVAIAARWRPFDVNGDRRFDGDDMRAIVQQGLAHPSIDANRDGRRDIHDSWHLAVEKTALDINGDGVVDAKDGTQAAPVTLPTNPAADIPRLVQDVLQRYGAAVPPRGLQQLRDELPYLRSTDRDTLSFGFLQAGTKVLLGRSLDAATWLYAKAVEATPDSAGPLAALGFALIEQGDLSAASLALARAHQVKPKLCVVNTNVGALHTRLGRPDQAIAFHREAVAQCPRSSIDRRNLATALLRAGHRAEAKSQYERAARLDPQDAEASLMTMATNPPTIDADAASEAAYETLRRSLPDWGDRPRWSALEPEEKVDAMLAMAEMPPQREVRRQWTSIVNAANDRIARAAGTALPEGDDMCADLDRWMKNWKPAIDEIVAVKHEAAAEARAAAIQANHVVAGHQLSLNTLLHQLAMVTAAQRRALYGGSAYEDALDALWREPMHRAEQRLRSHEPLQPDGETPPLDPDNAVAAVMMAFMGITAGGLDSDYAGAGECMKAKPPEPPQIQGDLAVGLSTGLFAVEFKPRTCEIKLTQGAGLIAYETWSPANGLSVAAGVGFKSPSLFPVELSSSEVLKFGSDGSVSLEASGQVGAGVVSWGVDATETLVPKQHEATGTSDWIRDVARDLGCDVS